LPLTPNGKVDRRALPAPVWTGWGSSPGSVGPRTPIEEQLAEMWRQLLGVSQVGVEDNFFELGGHSLLAAQLLARVKEVFQVELPLTGLFETPTVAGLAMTITQARAGLEDRDELARILAEIENLPNEVARAGLAGDAEKD